MGRNSSYHFTQIETDMHLSSGDVQQSQSEDKSDYRSADIIMEMKGYRLEVPSGQRFGPLVGQIRTPRGRVITNFSPRGANLDDLRTQFVDHVNNLLLQIETKFRDDLAHERIQGKIALRIDPKLHCELKIESTFQDKTLNSYIEEIAAQRIPLDRPVQSLDTNGSSSARSVEETHSERHPPSKKVSSTAQSDISRKLRQSPLAWTRMMSSLVPLAKKDASSDIVTFSEALGQLINALGSGIDQLSPYLEIHEGDEASLLKALGNMLLEASDALK
jgi:predicted HicB family RNase H-like nuclease